MERTSPRTIVALGVATVAGALLRFVDLTAESLWIDEIWSGYVVSGSPADIVRRLIAEDIHPPLFHLLEWPFPRLFGVDLGLRLPSAIFGVLAVPALFAVGRRLFDERTGLLAAVLLALSPFAVHAGRDARHYSLLLLLSLLATLALLRLRRRQDRRSAILLGLALAAMLYTQYMGGLFVAGLLLVGFFEGRETRRGAVLAGATALVLFLPFFLAARAGFTGVLGNYWIEPPTVAVVGRTFGGLTVLGRFPGAWPTAPAVLVSLLWLLAIGLGLRGARDRGPARLLLFLALFPVAAELAISTVRPLFLARTLIPIVPPLLLLAARGALAIPRPRVAAVLLAATLLPGSIALHVSSFNEDWRGAIGYVAEHIEPGDVIVVDPYFSKAVLHYGRDSRGVREAPIVLLPSRETVADVPALIEERVEGHRRAFWLIVRICDAEDAATRDRAMERYELTGSFERNAAGAFRFSHPGTR